MLRYPVLILALGLIMASSSVAARTFKIATLAPDGTSWMKEMRQGADKIKKMTDGRVKFRFFPGGIMGNDKSVMRKIKVGQLHGGAMTAGALSDISADSQIYTLPLAFRSLEEVDYVRQKMDQLIYDDLLQKGFVSFGLSEAGFAYLMSNKSLQKAEALKGQKVWIPEGDRISRAGFESVGVSPIPLPVSDVLTGLQTGLIDTLGTSTTGAIALQWHSYIKYITDMPLLYLYGSMIIKRSTYEKLSKQDQITVSQVMGEITKKLNAQTRQDNQEAYAALANQGIKFVAITQPDLEIWESRTAKAMDQLAEQGVFSKAILLQLRKHINEFRQTSGKR